MGYTSIPTVTIPPPDNPGTQATATTTINGGLSFIRPHGVIYDENANKFTICDSLRSIISSYDVPGDFQAQFGTPGSTANNVNLFYPASGKGSLTGTTGPAAIFADTRNNALKTMNNETIGLTTPDGSTPNAGTSGTGEGELYWPESVAATTDTAQYVLVANTLNNRVEIFSNNVAVLTSQSPFNFVSP